jgi:hypothetical protein
MPVVGIGGNGVVECGRRVLEERGDPRGNLRSRIFAATRSDR